MALAVIKRECINRIALLAGDGKDDIVREGTRLGVDYSITVSCYQADAHGLACGVCDSCRLRKDGFRAALLPDPTRYA